LVPGHDGSASWFLPERTVWLAARPGKCLRRTGWAEAAIERTLTILRLPCQHLKSTNMMERLNEELGRRTCVVRIFPQRRELPAPRQGIRRETNESQF
jgi:putative transposase